MIGVITPKVRYTGRIIDEGSRTLPVVSPKTKPATMHNVAGGRGIEPINAAAFDALKILRKINIPIIIIVKFQGFILRAIAQRSSLTLLITKDNEKAVLTPMTVASSSTGKPAYFLSVKSSTGATNTMTRGMSNPLNEKGL